MTQLLKALTTAIDSIVVLAARSGLLVWGVFMGRLIATGFVAHPRPWKTVLISASVAPLIALLCALYGYRCVVDPGESASEALLDAQFTFFVVLLPLLVGGAWGMVRPHGSRVGHSRDKTNEAEHAN